MVQEISYFLPPMLYMSGVIYVVKTLWLESSQDLGKLTTGATVNRHRKLPSGYLCLNSQSRVIFSLVSRGLFLWWTEG